MTKCNTCTHQCVCKYKDKIENLDKLLHDFISKDERMEDVKEIILIETGCKQYTNFSITSTYDQHVYPNIKPEAIPVWYDTVPSGTEGSNVQLLGKQCKVTANDTAVAKETASSFTSLFERRNKIE